MDGWAQDCCISIANALSILQSCAKPWIYISICFSSFHTLAILQGLNSSGSPTNCCSANSSGSPGKLSAPISPVVRPKSGPVTKQELTMTTPSDDQAEGGIATDDNSTRPKFLRHETMMSHASVPTPPPSRASGSSGMKSSMSIKSAWSESTIIEEQIKEFPSDVEDGDEPDEESKSVVEKSLCSAVPLLVTLEEEAAEGEVIIVNTEHLDLESVGCDTARTVKSAASRRSVRSAQSNKSKHLSATNEQVYFDNTSKLESDLQGNDNEDNPADRPDDNSIVASTGEKALEKSQISSPKNKGKIYSEDPVLVQNLLNLETTNLRPLRIRSAQPRLNYIDAVEKEVAFFIQSEEKAEKDDLTVDSRSSSVLSIASSVGSSLRGASVQSQRNAIDQDRLEKMEECSEMHHPDDIEHISVSQQSSRASTPRKGDLAIEDQSKVGSRSSVVIDKDGNIIIPGRINKDGSGIIPGKSAGASPASVKSEKRPSTRGSPASPLNASMKDARMVYSAGGARITPSSSVSHQSKTTTRKQTSAELASRASSGKRYESPKSGHSPILLTHSPSGIPSPLPVISVRSGRPNSESNALTDQMQGLNSATKSGSGTSVHSTEGATSHGKPSSAPVLRQSPANSGSRGSVTSAGERYIIATTPGNASPVQQPRQDSPGDIDSRGSVHSAREKQSVTTPPGSVQSAQSVAKPGSRGGLHSAGRTGNAETPSGSARSTKPGSRASVHSSGERRGITTPPGSARSSQSAAKPGSRASFHSVGERGSVVMPPGSARSMSSSSSRAGSASSVTSAVDLTIVGSKTGSTRPAYSAPLRPRALKIEDDNMSTKSEPGAMTKKTPANVKSQSKPEPVENDESQIISFGLDEDVVLQSKSRQSLSSIKSAKSVRCTPEGKESDNRSDRATPSSVISVKIATSSGSADADGSSHTKNKTSSRPSSAASRMMPMSVKTSPVLVNINSPGEVITRNHLNDTNSSVSSAKSHEVIPSRAHSSVGDSSSRKSSAKSGKGTPQYIEISGGVGKSRASSASSKGSMRSSSQKSDKMALPTNSFINPPEPSPNSLHNAEFVFGMGLPENQQPNLASTPDPKNLNNITMGQYSDMENIESAKQSLVDEVFRKLPVGSQENMMKYIQKEELETGLFDISQSELDWAAVVIQGWHKALKASGKLHPTAADVKDVDLQRAAKVLREEWDVRDAESISGKSEKSTARSEKSIYLDDPDIVWAVEVIEKASMQYHFIEKAQEVEEPVRTRSTDLNISDDEPEAEESSVTSTPDELDDLRIELAVAKVKAAIEAQSLRRELQKKNVNILRIHDDEMEDEYDEAAARIQAGVRGYQLRKRLSMIRVGARVTNTHLTPTGVAKKQGISPWWPLLGLLSRYPIIWCSHCNSFGVWVPRSSNELQWLE